MCLYFRAQVVGRLLGGGKGMEGFHLNNLTP
jgi:hypothetical protein